MLNAVATHVWIADLIGKVLVLVATPNYNLSCSSHCSHGVDTIDPMILSMLLHSVL